MALITAKDLYRSRQARLLKENVKNYINALYEYDDLDQVLLRDKHMRKFIIETIIEDVSGKNNVEVIAIDVPITVEDREKLNNYDEILGPELIKITNELYKKLGTYGQTIYDTTEEINAILGTDIQNELSIIWVNDLAFQETFRINRHRSSLWTVVHEVLHMSPVQDGDEKSVQLRTLDWLLKHGYHNQVYNELVSQAIDFFTQSGQYNTDYFILGEIVQYTAKYDKGLVYMFAKMMKEMLESVDISETIDNSLVIQELLGFTDEMLEYIK